MCELKVDGNAVQFFLPVAVAPRYTPAGSRDPLAGLTGALTGAASLAAGRTGLHLALQLSMGAAISSVTSSTHNVAFRSSAAAAGSGTVELGQAYTHLERDLVVLIGTAPANVPRLVVETSPTGSLAAMLCLVPELPASGNTKNEFIFVVGTCCCHIYVALTR